MKPFLKPLAWLYQEASSLHRQLYSQGFLRVENLSKPVLSIGNVSFGGTGKTPFVLGLVEQLEKRSLKAAVITRSYKGSLIVSQEVTDSDRPEIFGDEASFYKFKKPNLKVFSGPQKYQSAQLADLDPEVDIILIDDGFQHHKLKKNWNGILLDATSDSLLREPYRVLQYADAIFITRYDLVAPEQVEKIQKCIPQSKPTFFIKSTLMGLQTARDFRRVGLVSAIGNPAQLEIFFKKHYEKCEVSRYDFPDHHSYTQQEIDHLEKSGLDLLITTEKDEIKLRKLKRRMELWASLKIESSFKEPKKWQDYFDQVLKGLKK